jgi:hypothetical protein
VVFSVYSFTFLIVRLVAVYFFSSRINAESRKPVRILFSVSSETYNVEVHNTNHLIGEFLFKRLILDSSMVYADETRQCSTNWKYII